MRKPIRNPRAVRAAAAVAAVQTLAAMDAAGKFWGGSSGVWAGQRMLQALQSGGSFSPLSLRTLDTLQKDEWKHFDNALVQEAAIRLRGVADLITAGLVINIPNGMAKTVLEYEKITSMGDAQMSLDGIVEGENDIQEYLGANLPLPITHKDFFINLRKLAASRSSGEGLDVTQARSAGRKVAELVEKTLFQGSTKKYGGLPIYGYLTHPNRITSVHFGTNGAWSATAKTGENILADVLAMIAALQAQRFYGPYWIYVPSTCAAKLEDDFKANSSQTIRQRILAIDGVQKLTVADQLTDGHVVMMQPTVDVAAMVEGERLQTIQWDIQGGFRINFKAFTIQVPLIRTDASDRCGVLDLHAA